MLDARSPLHWGPEHWWHAIRFDGKMFALQLSSAQVTASPVALNWLAHPRSVRPRISVTVLHSSTKLRHTVVGNGFFKVTQFKSVSELHVWQLWNRAFKLQLFPLQVLHSLPSRRHICTSTAKRSSRQPRFTMSPETNRKGSKGSNSLRFVVCSYPNHQIGNIPSCSVWHRYHIAGPS